MSNNEEWRSVVNYEGLYEVSNLGRVKALGRWCLHSGGGKAWRKERILKPNTINGYYHVHLYKDGIGKIHRIHRLVANAFIPNNDPVNKTTVNHKNEIKTDNRVENLEWMSMADNNRYGTRVERITAALRGKPRPPHVIEALRNANIGKPSPLKGKKRPPHIGEAVRKALSKPVIQYDKLGNEIARFFSAREASRKTGFRQSHISSCCNGDYKQAYGFIWKYAKDVENA